MLSCLESSKGTMLCFFIIIRTIALRASNSMNIWVKTYIAIYMISSSVDPVDIETANKFDCIIDYVTKPLKSAVLKDIIKKHCAA